MILRRSQLVMIRKGQRWFRVSHDPKLKPGRVTWLRSPKGGEESRIEVQITVGDTTRDDQGYRVSFMLGNAREDERYIAAGWPDYTTDPFRAMPDEPQPFHETADELTIRSAWQRLGGG